MRRLSTTIFVSLTIILLVAALQDIETVRADSKTITVPDDYLSIQDAIDNAVDGDTIYVKKGTYVENPVIDKSVSLVGEDRDATVIDVTAGLKVERDNVTVTGLTIFDGYDGISLGANYCNISGNKITDSTHGIVLFHCENNSISGNVFQSIGLSSAIQLNFANKNTVKNNYISSCVEGIQIWQNSNNNTITENTIENCQDNAIGFQYSNDNTIMGNNITNSGCGTSIYGSNRNVISYNNYFYNTVQFSANESYYLSFGNNVSVNTIDGNYWSNYDGKDANGDGVGDSPYNINANNQDNHPLMKPVAIPLLGSNPLGTPTSTPAVPEFSWLTILPLLLAIPIGLSIVRKRLQGKV